MMNYNINQPEFIASILKKYDNYYYIFGLLVTLYMFVFYFIKVVFIDPENNDKGQMIAHVLLTKTPALMVYPSYA